MARPQAVQAFLDAAEAAVIDRAAPASPAGRATRRVFERTASRVGETRSQDAGHLPVCRHLAPALALAETAGLAAVAASFRGIEPRFGWSRRKTAEPADGNFWDGHANVTILGPGGIEERDDVWVGATLMAPLVTYVDHDHPPEEVYLALTPGEWWNAAMDWTDPGSDGLIYNPPGIRHAMRSGKHPFLALWFLPIDGAA